MAARRTGTRGEEVAVGLVGAEPFVRKMMELARQTGHSGLRVEPAVYERETDAPHQARQVSDKVDVLLFAGPLPYDLTLAAGELPVPALYVPTGGAALPAALVRAVGGDVLDPARVSVDSMTGRDVRDCYAEVGLPATRVRVQPYQEELRPDDYLAFHLEAYREGRTSGAITTIPTVVQRLADEGVPALMMSPLTQTLRETLRTAILTGSGARFAESRIAIVIVSVPDSALPARTSPGQYWYQEMRLALHREVLHDARRMDAIVVAQESSRFQVITTLGSLRTVTDDLAVAPFLARARAALNLDVSVGVGLGRSTLEAENNAYRAVGLAAAEGGDQGYLVGSDLTLTLPATASEDAGVAVPVRDAKDLDTLRVLVDGLEAAADGARLVDAEQAATLLGVTLRTARRTLRALVDAGLAWPMPPSRSRKVGRPPMVYQLLDERLDDASTSSN